MDARLLFAHALSPLHAGTGQGVDVIDLPIAREKATGLPFLPGSSVKGPLRERYRGRPHLTEIFGPETSNADEYAGSAQFSDLRLLLLPVRSLFGTFAWVTSPFILQRFARDLREAQPDTALPPVPELEVPDHCLVADNNCRIAFGEPGQLRVVIEDLDLQAQPDPSTTTWATALGSAIFATDNNWRRMLLGRFCIVHDDTISFLLQTATEITARIRLEPDKKTVATGGLWYEEALPAETILAGLVVASPVRATSDQVFAAIGDLTHTTIQLGGKATVGRGLCRLQLY